MLSQSHQPVTGTVLVTNDQVSNRELLEELLSAQGFKVVSVPDGAATLEKLSTHHGAPLQKGISRHGCAGDHARRGRERLVESANP